MIDPSAIRHQIYLRKLGRIVALATMTIGLLAAMVTAPHPSSADAAPVNSTPADARTTSDPEVPSVVPRPSTWHQKAGAATVNRRTRILLGRRAARSWTTGVTQPGLSHRTGGAVARQFARELAHVAGIRAPVSRGVPSAGRHDVVLRLVSDPGLGAEGYRLSAGDGATTVRANTSTGLYYGIRTIEQLLTQSPDNRTIPAVTARDVPDQQIRQVHLDAGRKYWEIEYLKNLIRRMSWLKMNTLYLHLSEAEGFRLYSPKFPGLADPESSYGRAEIAALQSFADRHHVMLIPGIDIPGHATAISETFGIGFGDGPSPCTAEHMHSHLTPNWAIDITNDRARRITADLLNEFLPWFKAPYAHIGADELPGQLADCPRVQQHLAQDPNAETLGDLLTGYINEMDDVVAANGKRTIIFNGVEHMDSPRQDVHDRVIFMTWTGDGADPQIPGHDEIAIGPFYVTPNNYHNLYPDEQWMYDEWSPSTANDMLGSGLPNWADYNFWADDRYFERLMATPRAILADRTWNASRTPDTVGAFRSRLATIGTPPGGNPPEPPERVDNGRPSHHWTFEPEPYPRGWTYAGSPGQTLFVDDEAGDLPGTSYIIENPEHITGVVGSAFRFDDDGDGVGFGGLDIAPPWTLSMWVRRREPTDDSALLSSKQSSIKLEQRHTCGRVGFTDKGARDYAFEYASPLGEWVRLSIVAEDGDTTLYVNGRRRDEVDATVNLPMRSIGDVDSAIRGDLDEMRVYDEALEPRRIAAAYRTSGHPGSTDHGTCQR